MTERFAAFSRAPAPPLFERPLSLNPSQEIAISIHGVGKYAAKDFPQKRPLLRCAALVPRSSHAPSLPQVRSPGCPYAVWPARPLAIPHIGGAVSSRDRDSFRRFRFDPDGFPGEVEAGSGRWILINGVD